MAAPITVHVHVHGAEAKMAVTLAGGADSTT